MRPACVATSGASCMLYSVMSAMPTKVLASSRACQCRLLHCHRSHGSHSLRWGRRDGFAADGFAADECEGAAVCVCLGNGAASLLRGEAAECVVVDLQRETHPNPYTPTLTRTLQP